MSICKVLITDQFPWFATLHSWWTKTPKLDTQFHSNSSSVGARLRKDFEEMLSRHPISDDAASEDSGADDVRPNNQQLRVSREAETLPSGDSGKSVRHKRNSDVLDVDGSSEGDEDEAGGDVEQGTGTSKVQNKVRACMHHLHVKTTDIRWCLRFSPNRCCHCRPLRARRAARK